MNVFYWILSIFLAVVYTVAGTTKLVAPRPRLLAAGMSWVTDVPMTRVRLVGLLEVAGAIGIIVPWATGILASLTPLAALGLTAVQVGAIATNLAHDDRSHLAVNVILLIASLVLAVGRFGG